MGRDTGPIHRPFLTQGPVDGSDGTYYGVVVGPIRFEGIDATIRRMLRNGDSNASLSALLGQPIGLGIKKFGRHIFLNVAQTESGVDFSALLANSSRIADILAHQGITIRAGAPVGSRAMGDGQADPRRPWWDSIDNWTPDMAASWSDRTVPTRSGPVPIRAPVTPTHAIDIHRDGSVIVEYGTDGAATEVTISTSYESIRRAVPRADLSCARRRQFLLSFRARRSAFRDPGRLRFSGRHNVRPALAGAYPLSRGAGRL